MTEQLSSQPSPEQPKRHIDTLPLDSPEIHYLYNYHDFAIGSYATEQYSLLTRAQIKYGEENVRVEVAMKDGKHVAIPNTYGIYVDAKKWAKLHPSNQ